MATNTALNQKLGLLTAQEANHLLRRTTFVNSWKTVQSFVGKTPEQAVELLLNNALLPAKLPIPTWVDKAYETWYKKPESEKQKALDLIYKDVYDFNYELKTWWMNAMAKDETSIREKMTLFWHGHFTTKFNIDQVMPAQLMYRQNQLFREKHQGNFGDLVTNICLDGAMVIYLNTQDSTKKAANENFSRELLELYTTGIGNYTEADVKEGAKVFTGIRTNYYSQEYTSYGVYNTFVLFSEHDFSEKNYLGTTLKSKTNTPDDIIEKEVPELVQTILAQRTTAVANYICEKLYKYFVYSNEKKINKTVVANMVKTFIGSKFEIRPVLAELLKSEFFFDPKNIGIQIKTPAESIVGITKHFDVKPDWKEWVMKTMGQELLNPPNVAGWPGYRKWADTRTYPYAVQQMGFFVWNQDDEYIGSWIKQFPGYQEVAKLAEQIAFLFLAKPITKTQIEKYTKILLAGSPDYEWANILNLQGSLANRIKVLLIQIIKAPDFHLS
jgi:uncharacterized protein (DUF1800 family)